MFSEIFYSKCTGCGKELEKSSLLCDECYFDLPLIKHSCETCGNPINVASKSCALCLKKRDFEHISCDYEYKGAIKNILKSIKFNYRINGSFSIGELINTDLNMYRDFDMIVPVPSHFSRKFKRIIHPAVSLAKYISSVTQVPVVRALKRKKITEYQWKVKGKERAKNVKGAFSLADDVLNLKILVVDDIITTGATINESAKCLKKGGADKIFVYTFAG